MSRLRLVVIVEGDGEVIAVPLLLRRLWPELGVNTWKSWGLQFAESEPNSSESENLPGPLAWPLQN